MKIYAATWLYEPGQGETLTKANHWNRLLSFWHTRDVESKKPGSFLTYVKGGTNENIPGVDCPQCGK